MARHGAMAAMFLVLAGCSAGRTEQAFDETGRSEIESGKRIAQVLGCVGCHGDDLTGTDWSAEGFATMATANLTRAVERYSRDELEQVIRSGRRPGPGGRDLWEMPSHLFTDLSRKDMDSVLAYVSSIKPSGTIHPEPVFHEQARKEIAQGIYKSSASDVREMGKTQAPDAGPEHDRARYIVRATCAECHGIDLRGGVPYPNARFRPDLRIVAAYDKADFMKLLGTGKGAGDRELVMMSDVARIRFAHFTASEREAVYAYLVALAAKDP